MRPANLASAADELYALTPAEFRAARDERAGQERAAGHRDLAGAISRFRRPTVSAWLVNQLAREAAGQVGRLLDLGESLRAAQKEMAGDRLRELSAQRREALPSLIQDAKRIASRAGQSVSAQVEREVLATFEAALADPAAAAAVRSGWLTSALSYVGLGGEDLAEAVAVPVAPAGTKAQEGPARARRKEPKDTAEARRREPKDTKARRKEREEAAARRAAREAEAAASDLREAKAMADEASLALADADRRAADVRNQQENLRQRIEELEQRLAAAEVERAEVARSLREAQRNRETAARSLDAARRRLKQAQARAERHRTTG